MKTESYTKPTEPFIMEDIRNSKYSILFNDLVNIQEETKTLDDGSIVPYYIYDIYKIEVWKRTNLKEDIKSNYKLWFEFARQKELIKLSKEMREKRNQLLNETDKEMVLDRLDLDILKEEITAANIVKGLKEFFDSIKKIFSSDMAKYRQELRDVPQQEGFPYDIKWPEKPAELQGYLMDQVQANQQQQNEKVDGNQDTIILE